jgi:hypothetical protein
MIVVAGPRIDPAGLPQHDGLEVHAYRGDQRGDRRAVDYHPVERDDAARAAALIAELL